MKDKIALVTDDPALVFVSVDQERLRTNAKYVQPPGSEAALARQPYSASAGTIQRVRTTGSADGGVNLSPQEVDLRALVVDGSNVYWTSGSNGVVASVPGFGGTTVTIYSSSEGQPVALALFGPSVYWANATDRRIRSAPTAGGGTPTTIVTATGTPRAVAAATHAVYWIDDPGGRVWALPR